jgi:hypothetical protein
MSTPKPSPLTFLAIVLLLTGLSQARAANLNPEMKKPYQLNVVLDVGDHRVFTAVFKDQVRRDLRDILQADLGKLAQVKVEFLDALVKKPRGRKSALTLALLKDVRARGLQKPLDGFKEVIGVKTHFVRLRFANGRYRIEARQHDGLTGMASPLVRSRQTSDRLLVARTAAVLVRRDFGLVGTVTGVNGDMVTLKVKGGLLKESSGKLVSLGRWVGPGEVFAVAQITRGGGGLRSVELQWALLQVSRAPEDGKCECQYFRRFADDRLVRRGGVLAYRCLKLTTVRAPLRLRLLDFETRKGYDGLQVKVSSRGFEGDTKNTTTDSTGKIIPLSETYAHVAFVSVFVGDEAQLRFPVAMLSDRTVDCYVSIDPAVEARAQKGLRRDNWVRRVYDSLAVAADRVPELNQLMKKSKLAQAAAQAEEGLRSLDADLKSLAAERQRLKKEGGVDLSEGDQRLNELRKRRQELDRFLKRLLKVRKEARDSDRALVLKMIARARLLESQADFAQAIKIYEKILDEHRKETNVRKRLKRLADAWVIQSKDHRAARLYIYEKWPKIKGPVALAKNLKTVRAKWKECQKAHDLLTPLKLLRVNLRHAHALKKRMADLRPKESEDDRKEVKVIGQVAGELKQLHEEITKYLKKEKPPI